MRSTGDSLAGSEEDSIDEVPPQFICASQPLLNNQADADAQQRAEEGDLADAVGSSSGRKGRRNSAFRQLRTHARSKIVRLLLQESLPALTEAAHESATTG